MERRTVLSATRTSLTAMLAGCLVDDGDDHIEITWESHTAQIEFDPEGDQLEVIAR